MRKVPCSGWPGGLRCRCWDRCLELCHITIVCHARSEQRKPRTRLCWETANKALLGNRAQGFAGEPRTWLCWETAHMALLEPRPRCEARAARSSCQERELAREGHTRPGATSLSEMQWLKGIFSLYSCKFIPSNSIQSRPVVVPKDAEQVPVNACRARYQRGVGDLAKINPFATTSHLDEYRYKFCL